MGGFLVVCSCFCFICCCLPVAWEVHPPPCRALQECVDILRGLGSCGPNLLQTVRQMQAEYCLEPVPEQMPSSPPATAAAAAGGGGGQQTRAMMNGVSTGAAQHAARASNAPPAPTTDDFPPLTQSRRSNGAVAGPTNAPANAPALESSRAGDHRLPGQPVSPTASKMDKASAAAAACGGGGHGKSQASKGGRGSKSKGSKGAGNAAAAAAATAVAAGDSVQSPRVRKKLSLDSEEQKVQGNTHPDRETGNRESGEQLLEPQHGNAPMISESGLHVGEAAAAAAAVSAEAAVSAAADAAAAAAAPLDNPDLSNIEPLPATNPPGGGVPGYGGAGGGVAFGWETSAKAAEAEEGSLHLPHGSKAAGVMCAECKVGPATVVFLPCRHLSCCSSCSAGLSCCPVCSVQVSAELEVAALAQVKERQVQLPVPTPAPASASAPAPAPAPAPVQTPTPSAGPFSGLASAPPPLASAPAAHFSSAPAPSSEPASRHDNSLVQGNGCFGEQPPSSAPSQAFLLPPSLARDFSPAPDAATDAWASEAPTYRGPNALRELEQERSANPPAFGQPADTFSGLPAFAQSAPALATGPPSALGASVPFGLPFGVPSMADAFSGLHEHPLSVQMQSVGAGASMHMPVQFSFNHGPALNAHFGTQAAGHVTHLSNGNCSGDHGLHTGAPSPTSFFSTSAAGSSAAPVTAARPGLAFRSLPPYGLHAFNGGFLPPLPHSSSTSVGAPGLGLSGTSAVANTHSHAHFGAAAVSESASQSLESGGQLDSYPEPNLSFLSLNSGSETSSMLSTRFPFGDLDFNQKPSIRPAPYLPPGLF